MHDVSQGKSGQARAIADLSIFKRDKKNYVDIVLIGFLRLLRKYKAKTCTSLYKQLQIRIPHLLNFFIKIERYTVAVKLDNQLLCVVRCD